MVHAPKSRFTLLRTAVGSLAVFWLLALAGCSLIQSGSGSESPAGGASDATVSSEGAAAGDDPAAGQEDPCHVKYYPLEPEVVQNYGVFIGTPADYSEPPTTYTKKQTIGDGDTFTEVLEFSNGIKTSVIWQCTEDGLTNDQLFGTMKGPDRAGTVVLESAEGVYLPKGEWKVGAKWSYEIKIRIKEGASEGGDLVNEGRIDYEIVSMDDKVKVPGGEFTAARLDSVSRMNVSVPGRPPVPATLKNSEWYAPGVGLVKVSQTGFNTGTTVYLGEQK